MTRAAHSWYLRNTYLENNLIKPGKITLKGEPIDLGRIRLDTYAVGAEKDHIVPWDAALAHYAAVRRRRAVRARLQRPYRGHHQPAGRQGQLLDSGDQRRGRGQPGAVAAERHEARGQLVARLVGLALRPVRPRRASRRRWAARSTRQSRTRREPTSWRSEGIQPAPLSLRLIATPSFLDSCRSRVWLCTPTGEGVG